MDGRTPNYIARGKLQREAEGEDGHKGLGI